MKGDFFQVTYRTPSGAVVQKVQAERDGSSIDATYPSGKDNWLTIEVTNKAGDATSTAKFAASEVISVVQGHEKIGRARKK